ncbi:MAG TPA: hypothetical protein VJQ56_02900 [Blastocatellia bacterium]|nr:hypothetical protein [Blastocatellia bacterium]
MKRYCATALLFTLFISPSFHSASSGTTHNGAEAMQAAPGYDLSSPESIHRYFRENEQANIVEVWRALGLGLKTDMQYFCDGSCETEIIGVDGRNEILKISGGPGTYYEYLFFRKTTASTGDEGEWRFLGSVESPNQQYGPPRHRVVSKDGRTWFVLRGLSGRGTGVGRYKETWHEIGEEAVNEVLGYPVEGHDMPWPDGLGRQFEATVIKSGLAAGVYRVMINYSVSYMSLNGPGSQLRLFTKQQVGSYVWDSATNRFILDEPGSSLSEEEIGRVYNFDSLEDKDFIKYNFNELQRLAARGSARRRAWLRGFLTTVEQSNETLVLQNLLQR